MTKTSGGGSNSGYNPDELGIPTYVPVPAKAEPTTQIQEKGKVQAAQKTESATVSLPNGKAKAEERRLTAMVEGYPFEVRQSYVANILCALPEGEQDRLISEAQRQVGWGDNRLRIFAWVCVAALNADQPPPHIIARIITGNTAVGILL